LPVQLSIHIEEAGNERTVNCEAILVGKKVSYPEDKRRIESQFFAAVRARLRELKRDR